MFGPIGMPEMVVIAVIALIIFGPRKLPELGKSLGKSIAEFKRASNELKNTLEDEIRSEELQDARRSAIIHPTTPATPPTPQPAAAPDAAPAAEASVPREASVSSEAPEGTTPRETPRADAGA